MLKPMFRLDPAKPALPPRDTTPNGPIYNVAEAAQYLGISPWHLRTLAAQDVGPIKTRLPSRNSVGGITASDGKLLHFAKADLDAYINGHRQKPVPPPPTLEELRAIWEQSKRKPQKPEREAEPSPAPEPTHFEEGGPLFDVNFAAAYLGISVSHLRTLVGKGLGPIKTVLPSRRGAGSGKLQRFTKADLDAYINGHRHPNGREW
jgi:hypothetical protein